VCGPWRFHGRFHSYPYVIAFHPLDTALTEVPALSVKYVPSWFPGAGFKRTAIRWSKTLENTVNKPHIFVKEQIVNPLHLALFRHLVEDTFLKGCRDRCSLVHF
jgi:hypothetical protein